MKHDQRVLTPPTGFAKFYAALRHVNIPLEWIGNKRLREQLLLSDANPAFPTITPQLVHSYNHSIHRAHGFEPTKLTTDDEPELYKRLYHSNVDPQFSFTAGDIVRLSKARKTFRKGYLPGWTEETFRIYKRYPTIPPTYTLQDFNSNEIEGRFYNEELQKIDKSTNHYWAIEKIIRTKG
ncbi:chromo domain-containing protein [Trichonephila clavipes]|nr:chromo domain-containing protein [Trichonephila clavipes]